MTLDSTIANNRGVDVSYPKLFRLINKNYIFTNPTPEYEWSKYAGMSSRRRDDIDAKMQIEYRKIAGDVNMNYWNNFSRELITDDYKVDWKVAQKYNHIKHKHLMEK